VTDHLGKWPVLPGYWPDPTVCRVGDTYYLANSSFEYFPGIPLHRSSDLRHWELIGNVADRLEQLDVRNGGASSGIFAPTLRFHDDRFWLITTDINRVRSGQLLFSSPSAEGPWSVPTIVAGVVGIDPDLAWDEDGTCYLTWCRLGAIAQVVIDPSTGEVLSEPRQLWSGTGMRNPEGPHLYRIGEWWYLLIAEGGTDRGHSVSIARATSPSGPFEGNPRNPILTHRSTDLRVQSVGHADLVETPEGGWAMVYHGTRPRGMFPEFHVLGRETHVADVTWEDGWPVVHELDHSELGIETAFSDDFTAPLHPRWVSPRGALEGVTSGEGLELRAPADGPGRPVTVRVQDEEWSATATLDISAGTGRLLVYLNDDHWYGLEASATRVDAVGAAGPFKQKFGTVAVKGGGEVQVRIRASDTPGVGTFPPPPAPDVVTLEVVVNGEASVLAELDGRYVSTEVAGGFTGRTVGVQAVSSRVVARSFDYRPGN
jgi:xylan 1,4-beta-xylosidase